MKKNFSKQFETMRDVMQSNIRTIKALLQQSESLSEIVESMPNTPDCTEIRTKLIESQAAISKQLDELVSQTLKLHESYKALVDKVFGE